MKKLTLVLASACILANSANAAFYVGAQVGPSFNTGEFSSHDSINTVNVHSSKGGAGAAFVGGVVLGYDYVSDSNAYFALEGSASYHSLDNDIRRSSTQTGQAAPLAKLKNSALYGIALHIGYQLENQVIPFVSLGGMGGKYKLSLSNASAAATRGINANTDTSFSKNVFGFAPGVGVKYKYDDLVVTTKYEYLMGNTISQDFTDTTSAKWNYSDKVRQHLVTVGVAYGF